MRITERLLNFSLLGSEWVLWLLIGLSVLSVAVMVERAISLGGRPLDVESIAQRLVALIGTRDLDEAKKLLGESAMPEVRVGVIGIGELPRGRQAAFEAMASARVRERLMMERYLGVLGTLGNNAPFIGLFGTVLGIIRAFADLSKNQSGGAAVVMAGISEALVSTAVGLLVAIPAVVAFNLFQGRVRRALGRIDAMAHLILSAASEGAPGASGAGGAAS